MLEKNEKRSCRIEKGENRYVFVYTTSDFSGEIKESEEGELRWIDDSNLLDHDIFEGDKIFLPWLEGKFFFARFVYKNNKIVERTVIFHSAILGWTSTLNTFLLPVSYN